MDLCSDEELVSAVSTCHLVAALDTDLIEQIKHIIYIHIFLLFALFVKDYFSLMHHDDTRAVFDRIAKIVGNHDGCELLFTHNLIRQTHIDLGSLRIQCSRVLIQDQEIQRCHRGHQK